MAKTTVQKIQKLGITEFLKRADFDVAIPIKQVIDRTSATAVVLFQNLDMTASKFGESRVMAVGPTCTFKSVEECEGKWLGDAPSTRLYPVAWCPAEEFKHVPS